VTDAAGNKSEETIYHGEALKVENIALTVGEQKSLTVKHAIYGEASEQDVTTQATFSVKNEAVATVSADGKITGVSAGETTMKVTYKGLEKTVAVKVVTSSGSGAPVVLTPEAVQSPISFVDVKGHWAESYIKKAALLGIINGYKDGTVRPNASLTRTQAVSMIVRALGLETNKQAPFKDIDRYAKATQAEIAAAYHYGIIKENDGKFRPGNKVTRAQLALMLQRAYEVKSGKQYKVNKTAPFSDFGEYNQETIHAISMLYELHIVDGSNGKYMPTKPTTRAHIAKMLINFLEEIE